MNHFIISYLGNKRGEMKFILPMIKTLLDSDKIKYIVEPYCGTSAFSYTISKLYPGKFTYVLNDNNQFLIELYDIMTDDDKINNFNKRIDEILIDLDKKKYKELPDDIYRFYLYSKIHSIRPGLYPLNGHNKTYGNYHIVCSKNNLKVKERKHDIINFMREENVMMFNEQALDVYKNYKDRDDCFIFLDPPYLLNTLINDYKNTTMDIYPYLFYNNPFNCLKSNEKATISLCVEKMWIIEAIIRSSESKFVEQTEYDKTYQRSKKKTKHVFIVSLGVNH